MRNRWLGYLAASLSVIFTLAACGSDDDFGEGVEVVPPGAPVSITAITDLPQASQAAATLEQATLAGINSGMNVRALAVPIQRALNLQLPSLARPLRNAPLRMPQNSSAALAAPARLLASEVQQARSLSARAYAPQAISAATYACTDGGSIQYSGTLDAAAGTFNFTATASSCREGGTMTNGPMAIQGDYDLAAKTFNATAKLGSGNRLIDAASDYQVFNFDGANLYSIDTLDLTLAIVESLNTTAEGERLQYATTINGKVRTSDFLTSYEVTYTGLKHTSTALVAAGATASVTATETLNGRIRELWKNDNISYTTAMTYRNYVINWAETADYFEYGATGGIETVMPPSFCFAGSFNVATVVPIRHDYPANKTVAGHVVINENNNVKFLGDGSVAVALSDGTSQTYASLNAFEGTCNINTLGNESNLIQVDFANGPVTTTGSTMLATLVWTGGDTSDMDTHLSHYGPTAPTATDVPDWHIYYADKTDGGIGALDIDDTQGYGPEHITLPTLPAGYYILYIDNFSLDADPSATVMVSLKIGDNAYAFPSHTFIPSAERVHRVADVRVEANGTVTLLPPDTSLLSAGALAPRLRLSKN